MTYQEYEFWLAQKLFIKRFRLLIVSLIDPENKGDWEPKFRKAIYNKEDNSKQINWIKSFKRKKNKDLIELIDFQYLVIFADKNKFLFKQIFDNDIYHLPTWLYDIVEVRNKIGHNEEVELIKIEKAWNCMEDIAKTIDDKELQNGLKTIKDKKNNLNKVLEEPHITETPKINEDYSLYDTSKEKFKIHNQPFHNTENKKTKNIIIILLCSFLLIFILVFVTKYYFKPKTSKTDQSESYSNKTLNGDTSINKQHEGTIINNNRITKVVKPPVYQNNPESNNSLKNIEPQKTIKNNKMTVNKNYIANTSIIKSENKKGVALMVVSQNGNIDNSLATQIGNLYQSNGFLTTTSFFKKSFITDGAFNSVFDGDVSSLENSNIYNYLDFIILGESKISYVNGITNQQTKTAKLHLEIKIISTKDLSIINSFSINESGIGFNDEEAKETAESHAVIVYKNKYINL